MLIVTEVSATGLAKGHYLWGPPTKASWVKDEAGYRSFAEYIVNDKFSISGTPVTVRMDKNVLTLSSVNKENPTEKANIELRPVWKLVPAPEDASSKREKTSQPRAAKRKARPNRARQAMSVGRAWKSAIVLAENSSKDLPGARLVPVRA